MLTKDLLQLIGDKIKDETLIPDYVNVGCIAATIVGEGEFHSDELLYNQDFYLIDNEHKTITTRDSLNGIKFVFDFDGNLPKIRHDLFGLLSFPSHR